MAKRTCEADQFQHLEPKIKRPRGSVRYVPVEFGSAKYLAVSAGRPKTAVNNCCGSRPDLQRLESQTLYARWPSAPPCNLPHISTLKRSEARHVVGCLAPVWFWCFTGRFIRPCFVAHGFDMPPEGRIRNLGTLEPDSFPPDGPDVLQVFSDRMPYLLRALTIRHPRLST